METNQLTQVVQQAIESIDTSYVHTPEPNKWKVMINDVDIQIAIDDPLQSGSPSLSLYFVIIQLPENKRAECIEELMRANFQAMSKYALYEDMILQLVDFLQTDMLNAENLKITLEMYANHVLSLRQSIYQRYFIEE